ncbi:hypothetical protein CXB51_022140 [Gossypium anomalum]|uniref:Retroviral polymerase SH3-like domain-containing protein n=1 Tax=Gossypium anomalum TaxID=47600 RepID=A0A8J5YGT8_9ROSI|nr:hypothetical protein CXB51_022140 [Gossypium anomalum]
MLSNANLPKSFWAEAASTACFLINRSPSVAIEKNSPQEVWSGNPTNYSDLKIFGCPAYAHVDNEKLEPRSIKCVFLGYKAGVKDIDANQEPSNYSEALAVKTQKSGCLLYKRRWNHSTKIEHGILSNFLKLQQLDAKTTFLHGELEEDIYMQQPRGFYSLRKRGLCLLAEKVPLRFETITKTVVQESAKPVSTPLAAHFRLSSALSPQSDDENEYMSHVPYSSVVGSLMYAMVYSRLDISYAVSTVSRYMANLDLDRRRSLTVYVFTIGGCAISWKATLQTIVALSTTEAEHMAITEACKEAIWLKGLFSELNEDLQISTVFCDN